MPCSLFVLAHSPALLVVSKFMGNDAFYGRWVHTTKNLAIDADYWAFAAQAFA
jgi:hypothetical protein